MIQRIQTVYLTLGVILSTLLFFFPMAGLEAYDVSYRFDIFGLSQQDAGIIERYFIPLIMNIVNIALGLGIIFLYKKRMLQVKLARLNMLIYTALVAVVLFYFIEEAKTFIDKDVENVVVNYELGMFFPLVAIVFTFLAIQAIRKDEKLVRSANRIR